MSASQKPLQFPDYESFTAAFSLLSVPLSSSELHGLMCGYLCAGATDKGEAYIRALMLNQNDDVKRSALLALFDLYAVSQQYIANIDFEFQMMLPDNDEALPVRAKAFSEWCEGFTQGLTLAGIGYDQFQEEDTQEAVQHMTEFAELDYASLSVDEADEKAYFDVSEYARMAVLRIYSDLRQSQLADNTAQTTH